MNKAESERLCSYLEERGYQAAEDAEEADLVVLNSCVVRESAESRVANKIYALRPLKKAHPDKILAVTGCFVNSELGQIKRRFPHIDYFFKPGEYPPWMERNEHVNMVPLHPSPSTYVPIIQGCNNFCSYCIIPYRRGREKSRPPEDVLCEIRELVRRGTKEVILLGQNVDSYGHNLPEKPDLADLLTELNAIDGLARIRFLTNHPKDMSSKLIGTMAQLDKVCEQINLPVQAGSDEILEKMRRGYTAEQYRELIRRIRGRIPEIALSTDVIVGFPSETDSQFQQTYNLLSEIKFDTVHVAAYSPRAGTIAALELEDDIPLPVKKERLSKIEKLQEEIATEINSQLLGRKVAILVESNSKGKWYGRTRTDKLAFFIDNSNRLGQTVNIEITRTSPWSLQGELSPDNTN